MKDPTQATHGASERTSTSPGAPSRAHRPALAVALDHGALDDVPIAIACLDGTAIVTANAEWRALLDRTCESPTPHGWLSAFNRQDRMFIARCLEHAPAEADVVLVDPDRSDRRVRVRSAPLDDDPVYTVITVATIGLGAAGEARLTHRATHDGMTGLVNRAHFLEQVATRLRSATGPSALLFIDLDDFKTVNDHLGHRVGDALLRAASERICAATRDGDIVGRLGGDELAVFCPTIESQQDTFRLAERLDQTIAHPFTLDDTTVIVDASVGIAFARTSEQSVASLIDAADRAMCDAKAAGGGRWATNDPPQPSAEAKQRRLPSDLRWSQIRSHLERAEHKATLVRRTYRDPETTRRLEAIIRELRRVVRIVRADTDDILDVSAHTHRSRINADIAAHVVIANTHGIIAERSHLTIRRVAAALRQHSTAEAECEQTTAQRIVNSTHEPAGIELRRDHQTPSQPHSCDRRGRP